MRFVEVDQEIEEAAGLALADVFTLHGEAYYRRVEREVLTRLLAEPRPTVLATGGSIVNDPTNFALLKSARAHDLAARDAPRITGTASSRRAISGRWPRTRTRSRSCAPCSRRARSSTPGPTARSTRASETVKQVVAALAAEA